MKHLVVIFFICSSFIYAQSKIELPEAPPPVPQKSSSHLSVKDNSAEIRENDEQLQISKSRPKNLYPGNDASEPSISKRRTPQFEFSFAN